MKQALVVYESLFGDARTIARAVAEGLSQRLPTRTVVVDQAPAVVGPEVGLLVVGGPNHQFGMPRPASRKQAAADLGAAVVALDVGLREWLTGLRVAEPGVAAAAFDTRLDHPGFLRRVDHASRTEEKLLRRLGLELLVPAEHFFVTSATGPLAAGEEERARRWGETLAAAAAAKPSAPQLTE